jgi:hypothetical protein
MAAPQYSGPWQRIRLKILQRDGYACQVRGPKCSHKATQVDHIVPTLKGGAWWDESNLRASCGPCNLGRVDRTRSDGWQRGKTRITLVVGPPGSGKARYVSDHMGVADLVVDYDAIASALGGGVPHAAVNAARNALLGTLRRGESEAQRAWIISANPEAESLFPYHDRVVVDPGEPAVLCAVGPTTDRAALVRSWYLARSGAGNATEVAPSRRWW